MKEQIQLRNKEIAEDQFILNVARKHKKIDEDGNYLSSESSDFDQEAYLDDINESENARQSPYTTLSAAR